MSEETTVKKDVVPGAYRQRYAATGGGNGDFIASALSAVAKDGPPALNAVKVENGVPVAKWATMNPGMQRMNLANVLRAAFLNGKTIRILGKEYRIEDVREDHGHFDIANAHAVDKFLGHAGMAVSDRTRSAVVKLFGEKKPKAEKVSAEDKAAAKAEMDKVKAEVKVKAEKAKKLAKAA